ncbi:hypothetical protein HNP84_002808 [Thermocatellispora tengchongensis]|uniref:Uncharacterized protein n=1 Tax=Thermocatellispora tengchongensis TaxID=1073253 RepID=A0A840P795_9ACTN|nr:hypothetical protein [Thermocatellispora tengchongensis]
MAGGAVAGGGPFAAPRRPERRHHRRDDLRRTGCGASAVGNEPAARRPSALGGVPVASPVSDRGPSAARRASVVGAAVVAGDTSAASHPCTVSGASIASPVPGGRGLTPARCPILPRRVSPVSCPTGGRDAGVGSDAAGVRDVPLESHVSLGSGLSIPSGRPIRGRS